MQPQKTYHFRLRLTDDYGNSYTGNDVTFNTPLPVEVWRQQYFGTTANADDAADTANPAGDGIINLMKYALWMDPAQSSVLPSPSVTEHSGSRYLSMNFSRNPKATDVTYEVQVADSPAGPWATIVIIPPGGSPSGPGFLDEQVLAIGGGFGTMPVITSDVIFVRDTVSVGDAPRRFMRLSVHR